MSAMTDTYARVHNQSIGICTRELESRAGLLYAERMTSILAGNIARLRAHLGDNQSAFARRLSVQQPYISKWESGAVVPSGGNVSAMATLAGSSFDAFQNERWEPKAQTAVSDQAPTFSVDHGEVVEITKLDLSLPMGPGAMVDDFVEEERVLFDLSYVRSFTRTPPHCLRLAGGAGDSMFPTLVSNDLVWIDTTQNQLLHSDRIYAASINGGAAIKRLRPVAGGARVLVISDNKTVDPYEVDKADIRIWGRVIRFARDL